MNTGWMPLLWFLAVLALIPLALWLLKRSPLAPGAQAAGVMRTVAVLPLAPGQRLVTVEVGSGEQRRWLVLGVTAQHISTLHTMAPQDPDPATAAPGAAAPSFAQALRQQLRARRD
ncbi:flagellar biosynthetic protein FliO [uncultured Azohydromonas sp.]|jgi:flagellar biosynthetic protein FliO|uniref:flagellar biosynthetic protein FliO n=1 Tax=uncultured Azohydromonas sp. TaxID=487342 RepID=UPI002630A11E|nr:flagellar biosynthetic protein FliO [uncultured Azohydromonas sp.]